MIIVREDRLVSVVVIYCIIEDKFIWEHRTCVPWDGLSHSNQPVVLFRVGYSIAFKGKEHGLSEWLVSGLLEQIEGYSRSELIAFPLATLDNVFGSLSTAFLSPVSLTSVLVSGYLAFGGWECEVPGMKFSIFLLISFTLFVSGIFGEYCCDSTSVSSNNMRHPAGLCSVHGRSLWKVVRISNSLISLSCLQLVHAERCAHFPPSAQPAEKQGAFPGAFFLPVIKTPHPASQDVFFSLILSKKQRKKKGNYLRFYFRSLSGSCLD